jgi:hypothetical protein
VVVTDVMSACSVSELATAIRHAMQNASSLMTDLVTQLFLPDPLGLTLHKLLLQDCYAPLLLLAALNITGLHSCCMTHPAFTHKIAQ